MMIIISLGAHKAFFYSAASWKIMRILRMGNNNKIIRHPIIVPIIVVLLLRCATAFSSLLSLLSSSLN